MNNNANNNMNRNMNRNMNHNMTNYTNRNNNMMNDRCSINYDCAKENECLDQLPVGMAYVPWQAFRDLYDPHMGLDRGTLFKELDFPFCGKRGNY